MLQIIVQNFYKEKSIYEIQFCIRNIYAITKVRSRQAVKLPAVQPVVMWTPALGRLGEKNGFKKFCSY